MDETLAQLELQISSTDPGDPSYYELVTLRNEIVELMALSEPVDESAEENLQDSLVGQKCCIRKFTRFGIYVPMNAIISEIGSTDELRVFFATPTSICESPCQRFLSEGSCFFDLQCPFSHGAIVQAQVG
ncbi:hypothetical protein Ciccas_003996 [Cichlidogyrus casuarinus]|uniref:C3H1-type domain-containing protein n=1 Tax=Cichlidogyrus casuarinus TaxID=1844966 RepID=A0ABD2QDN9_9PLAT